MKIGDLNIDGRLFLAPMCNVTQLPFRLLCKRYGASMMYSEMIFADAYLMESEKSAKKAYFLQEERPIGIQLTGSSVEFIKKAAQKAQAELKPDLIDINIGCPAYNVLKSGAGGALLKDAKKLGDLVKALTGSISIPLTCKIRITGDDTSTMEIARIIEKAGAKAVTVHGRTVKQGYSGEANWDIIKKIKESLSIPVILNGDIRDEDSAGKAIAQTECDAVMVGRAAIGNPFIFRKIRHYLETGIKLPEQSLEEKMQDFLEFLRLCRKYDYMNIVYIKMEASNFAKGFIGASRIRENIARCKTAEEIESVLKNL